MTLRPIDIAGQPAVEAAIPEGEPELRWLEISRLVVDESYQRPLGEKNWRVIRKIAAAFDWAKFTPVTVAPCGGDVFAIIDGQHRVHGAALAGITRVPVLVAEISLSQQAACFSAINSARTNVSAFHIFKAALTAGEAWAKVADAAVAAAGCKLMPYNRSSRQRGAGEIYTISLIRGYAEQDNGAAVITRALRALAGSGRAQQVALYQARILKPWLAMLWEDRGLCGLDLEGFVSNTDLVRVRDRVGELRDDPEFAKHSDYALAVKSFRLLLRKGAKDGAVGARK